MNKIKQYVELDKVTEIVADLFYGDARLKSIDDDIGNAYQKIIDLPRIELKEPKYDVRMASKEVQYREVEVNGKIHETAICPNCGSIFTQGSTLWLSHFCLNCGQKLRW